MNAIQVVLYIAEVVIFVVMLVEVWRSPMTVGSKILWTIFAFVCSLIALIIWFAYARRRAYGTPIL